MTKFSIEEFMCWAKSNPICLGFSTDDLTEIQRVTGVDGHIRLNVQTNLGTVQCTLNSRGICSIMHLLNSKNYFFQCEETADLSNFWNFDHVGQFNFLVKIADGLRSQDFRVIDVTYDETNQYFLCDFSDDQKIEKSKQVAFTETMQILCDFCGIPFVAEPIKNWTSIPWYGWLKIANALPSGLTGETVANRLAACLTQQGLRCTASSWYSQTKTLLFSGDRIASQLTDLEGKFIQIWTVLNELIEFSWYDFGV